MRRFSQVAVEPDQSVYRALHQNQRRGSCNFGIVHGVVAPAPEFTVPGTSGHGNTLTSARPAAAASAAASPASGAAVVEIAHLELRALERRLSARFNTLIVDCEGCLPRLLRQPGFLDHIDLLFLDQDQPSVFKAGSTPKVHYSQWFAHLKALGFLLIWRSHTVFDRALRTPDAWGVGSATAWRRASAAGWMPPMPSCEEHARRRGYNRNQLECLSDAVIATARSKPYYSEARWVRKPG